MSKEVYVAYGGNNEILYVGQGNIGRHKHCLSGISHNRDLNRYYFTNGDGVCISVENHDKRNRNQTVDSKME